MTPYGLVGGYQLSGVVEASVLKTEAIRFSETFRTYQTTRYHNPEAHNLEYRVLYLRNVGNRLPDYTVSQTRRQWEPPPPW
jgi:hypothetical protein